MKKVGVAAIAMCMMLTGCLMVHLPQYTPVPSDRIYYAGPDKETNPVRVVFTRAKRPPGGGGVYHQHIYLNGKRIASIRPGERLELNIPAGECLFGVKPTDPFGQHKLFTIKETLESGKDYSYRIVANANETRIERTPWEIAKIDLRSERAVL